MGKWEGKNGKDQCIISLARIFYLPMSQLLSNITTKRGNYDLKWKALIQKQNNWK